MPCYHPLMGYYARKVNESGKRSLTFKYDEAILPEPVFIACGRCIGCRLDRSLSWALRCVHEASLYEENSFITLTFDDDHCERSLRVSDFQNFMKRLRQKIEPRKVRFFHCGEYGEKFARPHHHACLFGYDFPDKQLLKMSQGVPLYTSEMLSNLWPQGFSTIGKVTFESASYVARYVMKKWSEDNVKESDLYEQMCQHTVARRKMTKKEFLKSNSNTVNVERFYDGRLPEYVTMSRRPGIGDDWFSKYSSDIYPGGFAVVNGKKVKPPKFYDSRFELDNVFDFAMIKGVRASRAQSDPNNTQARLSYREQVKKMCVNQFLKRSVENVT